MAGVQRRNKFQQHLLRPFDMPMLGSLTILVTVQKLDWIAETYSQQSTMAKPGKVRQEKRSSGITFSSTDIYNC